VGIRKAELAFRQWAHELDSKVSAAALAALGILRSALESHAHVGLFVFV
jgi:hypothetical protein